MNFLYSSIFEQSSFKAKEFTGITDLNELYNKFVELFGFPQKEGDFRYVWVFEDSVVKLARSEKQVKANINEIKLSKCLDQKFFAKIYQYDQVNFFWLQMERVNTNQDRLVKKIEEMFLVPPGKFKSLNWFAGLLMGREFGQLASAAKTSEVKQWTKELKKAMDLCSVEIDDLHEDNMGIRDETSDEFIDYLNLKIEEKRSRK